MNASISRTFLVVLVLCWAAVGLAEDVSSIKFPSPNGRFALRMTRTKEDETAKLKIELIEKASSKVMVALGSASESQLSDTILVWSADSKRAAYGSHDNEPGARLEAGSVVVYFWNGSAFDQVPLPENLPIPEIKFPKGAGGGIKPYGGMVRPLRWLKSGELEISSDDLMLSRADGKSYTAVVQFSIAFDAQHVPSVKTVGKSKTRVDP